MHWIASKIKWIMLVSGVLTCSMFYAAIAPQAALNLMFGDVLEGPLAEIIVRNWGAFIGLVGVMLIYGAYDPPGRPLILTVASASKLIYIGLVLTYGRQYLSKAGISVWSDSLEVVLFIICLIHLRRSRGSRRIAL